jgi:hypothetical protein
MGKVADGPHEVVNRRIRHNAPNLIAARARARHATEKWLEIRVLAEARQRKVWQLFRGMLLLKNSLIRTGRFVYC